MASGWEPAGANVETSSNSVTVLRILEGDIKRDRDAAGKWRGLNVKLIEFTGYDPIKPYYWNALKVLFPHKFTRTGFLFVSCWAGIKKFLKIGGKKEL